MSPYAINKLIYDMNPEKLEQLKENAQAFYDQYKLTAEEISALNNAIFQHRFKSLAEIGVLSNLLFRLARFCGYGPNQFADLMKE